TGDVAVTAEGRTWGLEPASLQGLRPLETEVRPTDARPLIDVGGTPAALVRPVGRGAAIYLNALLDGYPRLRRDGNGGAAYRALVRGLVAHRGLRAAVELRGPNGETAGPARIARYRFGASEITAVLLEPIAVDKAYGRDGVTVYDDSRLGPIVRQEVEGRLPRAARLG